MRWMPRSAAAMTSARVSPARLASSTPLSWTQALDRVEVGRVTGQRLDHQPVPLTAQPGGHGQAAVGGEPVPDQGRLLPTQRPGQLLQGADQGVGVGGADLMVEGACCAAAA